MKTLQQASSALLSNLQKLPPSSPEEPTGTDSATSALPASGQSSEITTFPENPSTPALTSAGTLGAVTFPRDREEANDLVLHQADKVAMAGTTHWLPQSVRYYLKCLESAPRTLDGRPLVEVKKPELSEEDAARLARVVKMLEFTQKPSSCFPERLIEAINFAVSELPYRSRGEEAMKVLLKSWAAAAGKYPIWAVEKAAMWWLSGARDGDALEHFLKDVRLAVGAGVEQRWSALQSLTN